MNDLKKDIRVYRFSRELVIQKDLEGRSAGPVPIFDQGGKMIGFATIKTESGAVVAECAIDPATPERLDIETNARNYWMDAALEYRSFTYTRAGFMPTVVYVHALSLTPVEIDGSLPIQKGYMT